MADLSDRDLSIREVLLFHRGKSNAITSSELAEAVGIRETNGNPTTRFAIRELIEATGLSVGACSEGYYVIETHRELIDYVDRLDARISGIRKRKRLVSEAFEADEMQQTLAEVAE